MSRKRNQCNRPLTELIAYLDAQIAELRAKLASVEEELEDYKQAELFGWPIVRARKAAREHAAPANTSSMQLVEGYERDNGFTASP